MQETKHNEPKTWFRVAMYDIYACESVAGKPVYRFPTDYRFPECITGYQIYRTSRRQAACNAAGAQGTRWRYR